MKGFPIALAFFPFLLLNGAETVFFERPLKTGDRFECLVNTSQSQQYTLQMPSVERPAVRLNTVKVNLSGILTVKKVNSAGKALEIEFEVHSLTGAVNGRAVKTQTIVHRKSGKSAGRIQIRERNHFKRNGNTAGIGISPGIRTRSYRIDGSISCAGSSRRKLESRPDCFQ